MEAPYEAVLGRLVNILDHSVERTITASEAFLLHMTKVGLNGDSHAARSTMAALENLREKRAQNERLLRPDMVEIFHRIRESEKKYGRRDSVSDILCRFKMATKIHKYQSTTRTLLSPWLVEAALERLGNRRLTPDEQETVVAATRRPHRVRWPNWWVASPAGPRSV